MNKFCYVSGCQNAGRIGRQSTLKRTTSAIPKVSFGNPRASMDMQQLPAVYISDEKGCLSPVGIGRNPRRSMDTPYGLNTSSHFKPPSLFSPLPRDPEEGGLNVELAGRNSDSIGKDESTKATTKYRNPQGPGEKKNPRRPSHGSGDSLAIMQASKSLDFSGFKRPLFSNPAFADAGAHHEQKKVPPKLGEPNSINRTINKITVLGLKTQYRDFAC